MTEDLTEQTSHRPWPLPSGPWIMFQRWEDLLFAHWRIPADTLRSRVPPQLALDTFDGSAWLAVAPFRITNLRARGMPAFPGVSEFPELNVRTYVTVGGKPGVYFFSLDAGSALAVAGARLLYHLPYFRAKMRADREGQAIRYVSQRMGSSASSARFVARYEPTGSSFSATPGSLEHWLIERYCLYAVGGRQRIYRGEIHHPPWMLQAARVELTANTMTEPIGIELPATPELCHYARRQDVLVWPPEIVRAGALPS